MALYAGLSDESPHKLCQGDCHHKSPPIYIRVDWQVADPITCIHQGCAHEVWLKVREVLDSCQPFCLYDTLCQIKAPWEVNLLKMFHRKFMSVFRVSLWQAFVRSIYKTHLHVNITFTFMHLADAFI